MCAGPGRTARLIVVGVVNPTGDRRVVAAKDGHGHHLPHHVGALLGLRPVPDRIADELVDLLLLVGLLDRFQGWKVGVDIRENTDPHPDHILDEVSGVSGDSRGDVGRTASLSPWRSGP